jgi:hypothetical protein
LNKKLKVGIISFYDYDIYINPKSELEIYQSWNKAWKEVFSQSAKRNIELSKYKQNKHKHYDKIIFIEIPRITDLIKVIYFNLIKKRVNTILLVNETFLGRARYMLRIPLLFDRVFINCEKNIKKFMSYKINTFAYPSVPSKEIIKERKSIILNSIRKNKLAYISSFKIALSKNGSYIFRYKLVKDLINHPKFFKLYGFGWDEVPLPFNIIGIALIIRIPLLKKLVRNIMRIYFKPLGKFSIAKSKAQTLEKYEFALAIEPTIGKFNSICEKIFDPMLSGSIPVYYGQEFLKSIPENTFIRIKKYESAENIIEYLKKLPEEKKNEYRNNIFKFLISKSADRYRISSYAKFIVEAILLDKKSDIRLKN